MLEECLLAEDPHVSALHPVLVLARWLWPPRLPGGRSPAPADRQGPPL